MVGGMVALRVTWPTALALAAAAACADSSGPAGSNNVGIRVVSRTDIRDTVLTTLAEPLEVEVRDDAGAVVPGIAVEFSALSSVREPDVGSVYMGAVGSSVWSLQPVLDTTDARGRASARVLLGEIAGPGGVVVSVPTLSLTDTIPMTILTGRIVAFRVQPVDTAVYVGRTYQLHAQAGDKWNNWRDTTAVYGGVAGGVAVSSSGVVTGAAISRAAIAVRVGNWADSVRASVIPVGTIAAHARRDHFGDSIGVVVVNLDESGFRRVVVETPPREYGGEEPPEHEMGPRWLPGGSRLVYQESRALRSGNTEGSDQRRLFVTELTGDPRPIFPASAFFTDGQPAFSPDGTWIYFVARPATDFFHHIWRTRADGTEAAPVGGVPNNVYETRPSVSPDGQWLAYVASGPTVIQSTVRVRNLVTGEHTALAAGGTSPRWSPRGDLIAYVNSPDYSGYAGVLRAVRPDGGGDRQVVAGAAYAPVVDWSPDGKFIIAARSSYGVLELIEVATGARIPLPYAGRLSQPAWRPGSSP